MKSLIYTIRFSVVMIICVISCIDPIEFEVPAGLSDSIVIQARVVKGNPSFVEVDVSRLFDFSLDSRRPLSVREVALYDDNNNQMILQTRVPGSYFQILNDSTEIQAEVGRGYKLRVETLDNRNFESSLDIMPANRQPQDLRLSIVSNEVIDNFGGISEVDQIRLAIDTEVNMVENQGVYWEISNTYKVTDQGIDDPDDIIRVCYIEDNINVNDIYVLDPTQLRDGNITDFELAFARIDRRISEGLFFNVRQYSLSPGAFRYWNAINFLSEREGSIFDGPVGEIKSNFTDLNDPESLAFGYFFATEEEIIRRKAVFPALDTIPPICPSERPCFLPGGDSCICGLCCNCLLDSNSTTEVPDYWF